MDQLNLDQQFLELWTGHGYEFEHSWITGSDIASEQDWLYKNCKNSLVQQVNVEPIVNP